MSRIDQVDDVDVLMEQIRRELGLSESTDDGTRSRPGVEEILRRVDLEIANRRSAQEAEAAAHGVLSDGHASHWRPAAPRLPSKGAYDLQELLAFSDADFIDVAYRTLLRRPPDESGRQHYLQWLRSGASKVEIMADLRWSPEGRARDVHVDGLLRPYLLDKWSRLPFVGPVLSWVRAFAHLGRLPGQAAALEAAQAQEVQMLGQHFNRFADNMERRLRSSESTIEHRENTLRERLAELERVEAEHADRMAEASRQMARIEEFLEASRMNPQAKSDAEKSLDSLYAAFEDRFRGETSLVRARVEPYLELIQGAGAGTPDAPVIDLGCGRGEWLELLRDHGLVGRGIDLNTVFLEYCRQQGLDVEEVDAIEGLRGMADASAGAVTSMHLVEHLAFEQVVALIDEALRALRPDGVLVLETPNPENPAVGSHLFYMDPTHRNPLPPEMLRWLVEARGFVDVRVERLTLARETGAPAPLGDDIPGATTMNRLITPLHAALDYAVIARRP
jgi:SAM-dependent methyltransferase